MFDVAIPPDLGVVAGQPDRRAGDQGRCWWRGVRRSLSVAGSPVKGDAGCLGCSFVVGQPWRTEPGSRWSARSDARTNDLDAGEGSRRIGQRGNSTASGHRSHLCMLGSDRVSIGDRATRGRPALSRCSDQVRRHDGDRVPARAGAAARSMDAVHNECVMTRRVATGA